MNSSISSWDELANLIKTCHDGKWIFRGENKSDQPLCPKAGRLGRKYGAARKKPYDIEDEKKALDLFKKQARPYLSHQPQSEIEWLAIAQHHGMATRLLDWTESLLVAAYFAVEKAGTKGDAVIYGVRNVPNITEIDEAFPFEIKEVLVYHPPHITPRIPAQRSVFTIHPDPTEHYNPNGLRKWIISKSGCGFLKTILDACAINESSLFPDLDGLSRYIGWKYKWGKL